MTTAARPRSAEATRARILEAARAEFARKGYDGTTIRAVATAAEVDAALVMRYFESKAGLFAQSAHVVLDLPDLTGLDHQQIADTLVGRFFQIWEEDDTFLVLLRASGTSELARARMLAVFAEQAAPAIARAAVDRVELRAALVGTQVLGFAFGRYILRAPPLVALTRDDVRRLLGAAIVRFITDPHPEAVPPG